MEDDLLTGIRVLDFSQYLSGPCCTRMLAELGADVIKVELAPGGDPSRGLPALRNGRSAYFVQQNRGKRSVCIDLAHAGAPALVARLAAQVDVIVENFGPGVAERKGLVYEHLAAANPGLVMASITGFGRRGSLAHKVAFDLVAQAYSGFMHMTGDPDGPPTFVSAAIGDQATGLHAFGAIGHALFARTRTGKGQHIELSLVDSLFWMHEVNVQAASVAGDDPVRAGRHHPAVAPAGVYRSPEGWLVMLCLERQWPSLSQVMGRPDLLTDERYTTNADRVANRLALQEDIEAWFATFPSDAAVLDALEVARIPCSKVVTPAQALDDPYFVERRMVRTIEDPVIGRFQVPGFPFKFSGRPGGPDAPEPDLRAAALGEHNAEVLRELLDLSGDDVVAMRGSGLLHAEAPAGG